MSAYSVERLIWFVRFMERHRKGVAKRVIDQAWVSMGFNDIYHECPPEEDDQKKPDGNSENKAVAKGNATTNKTGDKETTKRKPRKLVSLNVMPRQTFNRYRVKALDLFGINILYNSSSKTYYIEDIDDYRKDLLKNWLVDTYGVFEYVQRNSKLQQNIMYEDIPSGRKYLDTIFEAINKRNTINFKYDDFNSDGSSYGRPGYYKDFRPCGLRLYACRWYLIGYMSDREWFEMSKHNIIILDDDHADGCRFLTDSDTVDDMSLIGEVECSVLPLDRISNLAINTGQTYQPPVENFDIKELFSDYVGPHVNHHSTKQTIVLTTTPALGKRLEALPMHHSQKKIGIDDDGRYRFELKLRPTHYFYAEILKLGSAVRIESPKLVIYLLRDQIKYMAENYAVYGSDTDLIHDIMHGG